MPAGRMDANSTEPVQLQLGPLTREERISLIERFERGDGLSDTIPRTTRRRLAAIMRVVEFHRGSNGCRLSQALLLAKLELSDDAGGNNRRQLRRWNVHGKKCRIFRIMEIDGAENDYQIDYQCVRHWVEDGTAPAAGAIQATPAKNAPPDECPPPPGQMSAPPSSPLSKKINKEISLVSFFEARADEHSGDEECNHGHGWDRFAELLEEARGDFGGAIDIQPIVAGATMTGCTVAQAIAEMKFLKTLIFDGVWPCELRQLTYHFKNYGSKRIEDRFFSEKWRRAKAAHELRRQQERHRDIRDREEKITRMLPAEIEALGAKKGLTGSALSLVRNHMPALVAAQQEMRS